MSRLTECRDETKWGDVFLRLYPMISQPEYLYLLFAAEGKPVNSSNLSKFVHPLLHYKAGMLRAAHLPGLRQGVRGELAGEHVCRDRPVFGGCLLALSFLALQGGHLVHHLRHQHGAQLQPAGSCLTFKMPSYLTLSDY